MISQKRLRHRPRTTLSALVSEHRRELWLAQPPVVQVRAVLARSEPLDVHEISRAIGFPTWASADGQASKQLKIVVRGMLAAGAIRRVRITTERSRERRWFYALPKSSPETTDSA